MAEADLHWGHKLAPSLEFAVLSSQGKSELPSVTENGSDDKILACLLAPR